MIQTNIVANFLFHERLSNFSPFFPFSSGAWFCSETNFDPWCQNSKSLVEASVVYINDQQQDSDLALITKSSSQGNSPYSYENVKQIFNIGQYLNLSKNLNHFGVELMVETNKELLALSIAFENLANRLARILLYYHKS